MQESIVSIAEMAVGCTTTSGVGKVRIRLHPHNIRQQKIDDKGGKGRTWLHCRGGDLERRAFSSACPSRGGSTE